jgi:hypothetical protein
MDSSLIIPIVIAVLVGGGIGAFLLLRKKKDDASPLVADQWTVRYSTGMPASFKDRFTFPQPPGSVHYVVRPPPGLLHSRITLRFAVEGPGRLVPTEGGSPAAIRLFLQRRGDNLSAQGQYEHYRWWSRPMLLIPGEHEMSYVLEPEEWTSVYGKHDPAGFIAALADLDVVGFTFGGDFAGHGVYAPDGGSTFIVREWSAS